MFGLIMGTRAKTKRSEFNINESIHYLQMADSLNPNNEKILTDLAYSHINLGLFSKKNNDKLVTTNFNIARKTLKKAISINKEYGLIYQNLAFLEYYPGNFSRIENILGKSRIIGNEN